MIGFCLHLAERHPKAHGGLLAKLLPYNLHADVNTAVPTITSVNIVSVPSGVHFSPEQMECAQQGKPFTIDYDQMREEPAPVEEPIEVRSPEEEQLLATLKAMNAEELLARLSNALVPQG